MPALLFNLTSRRFLDVKFFDRRFCLCPFVGGISASNSFNVRNVEVVSLASTLRTVSVLEDLEIVSLTTGVFRHKIRSRFDRSRNHLDASWGSIRNFDFVPNPLEISRAKLPVSGEHFGIRLSLWCRYLLKSCKSVVLFDPGLSVRPS